MFIKQKNILSCIVVIALISLQSINAQDGNLKLSAGGQFHFANLNIDQDGVITNYDPGAGINLGIAYSLNENWSIHSGVGLTLLRSTTSFNNYADQTDAIDREGEAFDFIYEIDQYSEKQRSLLVSLPVTFQYESNGAQTRFYSRIGASANFFVNSTSQGEANSLVTSGYFERFNATLTQPRFIGFGTFNDIEFNENDLELNTSINAILELGIKERVKENNWIYIGLFLEYGINNILTDGDNDSNGSLVNYNTNSPTDFLTNSALYSSNQASGQRLFDEASLNMIGLRVRYEFGI